MFTFSEKKKVFKKLANLKKKRIIRAGRLDTLILRHRVLVMKTWGIYKDRPRQQNRKLKNIGGISYVKKMYQKAVRISVP